MPFLDIYVTLENQAVSTTVYRKATDTNVMLNYSAVAPFSWKKGLIKCLLHRADIICSDNKLLHEEYDKLKNVFANNGYPVKVFETIKQQHMEQNEKCDDTVANKKEPEEKLWMKIPYIGKISSVFGKKTPNNTRKKW